MLLPAPCTRSTIHEDEPPYYRADTLDANIKKQALRVHQNRVVRKTPAGSMLGLLLEMRADPDGPGVLPESIGAWAGLPYHLARLALLLRFNQYRFLKQLHRNAPDRYPSPRCDLCDAGEVEGQAHGLGGCRHDASSRMYTRRHGEFVYACLLAALRALGCPAAAAAEGRVTFAEPAWLLPEEQRASTPDLLLVPTAPSLPPQIDRSQHEVVLVECFQTYCPNLAPRWAQKRTQHTALRAQLRGSQARGWRWRKVTTITVGVTHSGLVTGTFAAFTDKIGAGKAAAAALLQRVVRAAVQGCSNVLAYRKGVRRNGHTASPATDPPAQHAPVPPADPGRRRRHDGSVDESGPAPRPTRRQRTAPAPRAGERRRREEQDSEQEHRARRQRSTPTRVHGQHGDGVTAAATAAAAAAAAAAAQWQTGGSAAAAHGGPARTGVG